MCRRKGRSVAGRVGGRLEGCKGERKCAGNGGCERNGGGQDVRRTADCGCCGRYAACGGGCKCGCRGCIVWTGREGETDETGAVTGNGSDDGDQKPQAATGLGSVGFEHMRRL